MKIFFAVFTVLVLTQVALGMPDCSDLEKLGEQRAAALRRFTGEHQKISQNNHSDYNDVYFPELSSEDEKDHFYIEARKAVEQENKIVDQFAQAADHVRTAFDLKFASDFVEGGPPTARHYWGLWGEVFQASQFEKLNEALGDSGLWFVFRAYSWGHLGYEKMAGPHMSVVIGNRVYEVGRPLQGEGDNLSLTMEGRAGPVAMNIKNFLRKAELESEDLQAEPGIFFAERLAGVGRDEVKALADYYENEAILFATQGKFKYSMDPKKNPNGHNCVTYLTDPMRIEGLIKGYDLKKALALRRYTVSPVSMIMETAGFMMPKLVKPFIFINNNSSGWRNQLDQKLKDLPLDSRIEDPNFPGMWYDDPDAHAQTRGFFFRRMQFFRYMRPVPNPS